MIFGTFDGLHPGHLNLFKQARSLAKFPHLIVSIARDLNVKRIKKIKPRLSERKRMLLVKKNSLVDRVVLGGVQNHLPHIIKERPDIIALGYDQKDYVKNLKILLKKAGLSVKIVRLRAFKPKIYKNRLLKGKTPTAFGTSPLARGRKGGGRMQ